jgi:archaellin
MLTRRKLVSGLTVISLVGVSGCTQNQATQTSTETTATTGAKSTTTETDEVTAEIERGLEITGLVGAVNDDGDKIQNLEIKLGLVSGSEPVNLSELIYTIGLPEESVLINGNPGQTDGLDVRWVEGLEQDPIVLSDTEDLVVINLELSNISQVEPIKTDVSFTISIDVPNGSLFKAAFLTPKQEKLEKSGEYVFHN